MGPRGFTLFELMIGLFLMSVLALSAVSNLAALKNPIASAAATTVGFIKQVRSKAAATTSAYFITVDGADRFVTAYAANCSAALSSRTSDPGLTLELPAGVSVINTDWSTCFTSRGLASSATELTIQDVGSRRRLIEVFLGGAVRVN